MIPVDQENFGDGKGDCFAACLASIFELELRQVPNFCVEFPKSWLYQSNKWLATHTGLCLLEVGADRAAKKCEGITTLLEFPCYHLICGKSPRGDFLHQVVGFRGEVVHDPHPSRLGVLDEFSWGFFIQMTPDKQSISVPIEERDDE